MPNFYFFGDVLSLVIKARTDVHINRVGRMLEYYSSITMVGGPALKSKCLSLNPGSAATCELGDHEQVLKSFCFLIFKMGKKIVSSITGL